MLLFVVIFCVVVALGFGVASGWTDFAGLKISNTYSLAIMGAFVPAFVLTSLLASDVGYFLSWQSHLIAGASMFVLTFALFSFRMIGAGDSKLASAFALWLGMQNLPAYLFYMTVMGGLLGIFSLILKKRTLFPNAKPESWIAQVQSGTDAVPYGIAITFGAATAFYHAEYFDLENLAALGEIGF